MNVPDGGLPSSWPYVWGCTSSGSLYSSAQSRDHWGPTSGWCATPLSIQDICDLLRVPTKAGEINCYLYSPCGIETGAFLFSSTWYHTLQPSEWLKLCMKPLNDNLLWCLDQNDHGKCCPVMSGLERSELHVRAECCQKERHCHLSCKWGLVWWGWKNAGLKSRKPGLELACDLV